MPNSDSIGELFLVIKKKNEELEALISSFKEEKKYSDMENGALRLENLDLKDQNAKLQEKVLLLQHQLDGYERHHRIRSESHTNNHEFTIWF